MYFHYREENNKIGRRGEVKGAIRKRKKKCKGGTKFIGAF